MSDPDKDGNQEVLKPEATTLETPNVSLSSRIKMICANCRQGHISKAKYYQEAQLKKNYIFLFKIFKNTVHCCYISMLYNRLLEFITPV